MVGDMRSLPSEQYALQKLDIKACIRSEDQLMNEYTSHVPEGIFVDTRGRIVSVEVKRIIGNWLPVVNNPDGRRRILRRGRIVWPWKSTVESALRKADSPALEDYRVSLHYVVLVIPDSLSDHHKTRLEKHVHYIQAVSPKSHDKIKSKIRIFWGPDELFDRLS